MTQEEKTLLGICVSIILSAVVFAMASRIANRGKERFMEAEMTKSALTITLGLVGMMVVLALSSRTILKLLGII